MTIEEVLREIRSGHFVGGRYLTPLSQTTYTALNPANNQPLVTLGVGGREDIARATVAAKEAFVHGPWPRMNAKVRSRILVRFAELIRQKSEFLGTLEALNVGKLKAECINQDVARAADNLDFFAQAILHETHEEFFREIQFLDKKMSMVSLTRREPVGVAGLIVPWNSPLMLATWKSAPCLAAGNTCVVKPPIWAPLSVLQLGTLANEAGLPAGVLNIVPGGAEAGEALVRHSDIARMSFTGSVAVGKAVAVANAQTRLSPLSLELGGKAPSIVLADADLDLASRGVVRGAFRSQGQSCVAASRVLIEEPIYDSFLERLVALTEKMKLGDPLDPASDMGPLITREHLARVEGYIQSGISQRARLITGGSRPKDAHLMAGNYLQPTLFDHVLPSMSIVCEEIFGPVLAVMSFKTLNEAIGLANSTPFGLSANIWGRDVSRAHYIADQIEAGMIWINSHFVRDLRAPFGGRKESGIGSEGGRYSLEFYTQPKMICTPHDKAL